MADNCPCSPLVTGVPASPAVLRQHACSLPAGIGRTPHRYPHLRDKQGPRGMESGLSQQEQLWGTESEIWGGKLEMCLDGKHLAAGGGKGCHALPDFSASGMSTMGCRGGWRRRVAPRADRGVWGQVCSPCPRPQVQA